MRNEMHSFVSTPQANIPRSRFSMPCNVKFTGNVGKLIPFYVAEVLPGDTFDVKTSVVCRLQTLIHPIMDNMYLDTYYFFCPNRLIWDNWQHFCGEPDRAWVPSKDWTVPQIARVVSMHNATEYNKYFKDTILDYMGIGINPNYEDPSEIPQAVAVEFNALPVRAYNKIYDDWYRDENLEDPINLYTGDNTVSALIGVDQDSVILSPLTGGEPYTACKLHDYFTSALPQAQRGNPATLVINKNEAIPVNTFANPLVSGSKYPLKFTDSEGTALANNGALRRKNDGSLSAGLDYSSGGGSIYPNNLGINLNGMSLGITINDLRMAFQVQKFMERSARGGARYIELIKSMFGVTSPDARLQRTEYLGGHRIPINIHQM